MERACEEVAITTLKLRSHARSAPTIETIPLPRPAPPGYQSNTSNVSPARGAPSWRSRRRHVFETRRHAHEDPREGIATANWNLAFLRRHCYRPRCKGSGLGHGCRQVRKERVSGRQRDRAAAAAKRGKEGGAGKEEERGGTPVTAPAEAGRLVNGVEAARARAERSESQVERMVADGGASLRAEPKAARQQAETNGERPKPRPRQRNYPEAEGAEAIAMTGIDTAAYRASSLEETMESAEVERAHVFRRLTRNDRDLVASPPEGTVLDLEAVKLALLEVGSPTASSKGSGNSVGDGGGGGRGRVPGEVGVHATWTGGRGSRSSGGGGGGGSSGAG
ncbi:unnamed protein product [Ectocarpus fasciculatus]